jgi:hypothetical protein
LHHPYRILVLHRIRSRLLAILLSLFDLVWQNAVVFAGALVDLTLVPRPLAFVLELLATCAQLCDGLLRQQLLEGPLLDVLLLVLLQLSDELYGPLEDRPLVLFAAWYDLGQFVDAFVDGLAAAAFD